MATPAEEFRMEEYVSGDAPFVSYADHMSAVEKQMELFEAAGPKKMTVHEIAEKFGMIAVQDDDGDYEFFGAIEVPRLARMANKYGVFQIGNTVHQFKADKTLAAELENVADFTDLSTALKVEISTPLGVPTEKNIFTRRVDERDCTDNYMRNHRLKVHWFSDEYKVASLDYTDIWIDVRHQKRSWTRAWVANQEDEIRTDGSITHHVAGEDVNNLRTTSAFGQRFNTASLKVEIMTREPRSYPKVTPDRWIVSPSNVVHRSREGTGGYDSLCHIIE
jgi:hypothetical protein